MCKAPEHRRTGDVGKERGLASTSYYVDWRGKCKSHERKRLAGRGRKEGDPGSKTENTPGRQE